MLSELEAFYSFLIQKMTQILAYSPALQQELLNVEQELGSLSTEELLFIFDAPENLERAITYYTYCFSIIGFSVVVILHITGGSQTTQHVPRYLRLWSVRIPSVLSTNAVLSVVIPTMLGLFATPVTFVHSA